MSQTTESTYPSAATADVGATGPDGGASTDVLESAKDEAAHVTREATEQIKGLWREAQSDLTGQAASQQVRATQGLRDLADQLQRMVDESSAQGPARELIASTARRGRDAADWLDDRDPGSLLEEARGFARRRPGSFLAIAAGVGLLAGRLTRGLSANGDEDPDVGGPTSPAALPSSTGSGLGSAGPSVTHGRPAMAGPAVSTPVAAEIGRTHPAMDDVPGAPAGSLHTTSEDHLFDSSRGGSDQPRTATGRGTP